MSAPLVRDYGVPVAAVYFTCLVLGYQLEFLDRGLVQRLFRSQLVRWLCMGAAGYAATQNVPACAIGLGLLAFTLHRRTQHDAQRTAPTSASLPMEQPTDALQATAPVALDPATAPSTDWNDASGRVNLDAQRAIAAWPTPTPPVALASDFKEATERANLDAPWDSTAPFMPPPAWDVPRIP